MGYRTVVMLNNDNCYEWSKDPQLGQKIRHAMNFANGNGSDSRIDNYGRVVECVHADTQTLVKLDRYTKFEPLAYTFRAYGVSTDEDTISTLKEAASKLGYSLVKKRKK